ncbi:VOC family protein [Acinetobacter calcoaceticus]|uniref:VOC family protein n=1 Tax=Acinetobacter calcoaceticus TaxID=471 RepID=UPI0018DC6E82|nr:VOC family protein [Acinetobacter calcoaceticus]
MNKLHRVVVAVKDLDEAAGRYERIFAVPFVRTGPYVASMGVKVAGAWGLGVELIQPMPGSDSQFAQDIQRHLNERGEGLYGVVFQTRTMKSDIEHLEKNAFVAYGPTFSFSSSVLETEFGGAFSRFEETVFTPERLGYLVAAMDASPTR